MKIYDFKDAIKRTKLIATLGPSTDSEEKIYELYKNGMTTIRLNFSHADYNEHGRRIDWVHNLRKKINKPISIMLDTKGPEIRVGKFENGQIEIPNSSKVLIYTDPKDFGSKICKKQTDHYEIQMSYDMSKDVKANDKILVDDGKLVLIVKEVKKHQIICESFNHHIVKTNKRVNLPGVNFSLDFLAQKDIDDINFGIDKGIDYIAASFVNSANDVKKIKEILKSKNAEHIQIISKIESQVGIDNIDEIIDESDGIMIARGDLGLEIPYYEVPYYEKLIIRKCREKGKNVIVATQMLESMISNPSPTRAEVTDVYYATELGVDSVMLSGETANGEYPFICVKTMSTICMRAEVEFYNKLYYSKQLEIAKKTSGSCKRAQIATKLVEMAIDGKYRFAIVLSRSGELLKYVSKFRSNVAILGVSEIKQNWTRFGIWHSIFMNKIDNYDEFAKDQQKICDLAKSWGAIVGEKILIVRNENINEIKITQ